MQLEIVDPPGDRGARPRQEARADAVRHRAEPQVEARRLDLVGGKIVGGRNGAGAGERHDHVIRQDAFLIDGKSGRQGCDP